MKILPKESAIYSYSSEHKAALVVDPGELFQIETHMTFPHFETHVTFPDNVDLAKYWSEPCPVTGPVFVRGARPDSTLKIEVVKIEPTSNKAFIMAIPGEGAFKEKVSAYDVRVLTFDKGYLCFADGIKIPTSLMIGKIATAPKQGCISTSVPGPFGGNMDNKDMKEGSTVCLPVFCEGGMIAVGDIHAAMGDGESLISAAETMARITLRCDVIQEKISHPMIITEHEVMNVVSADTLDTAARVAVDDMAGFVARKLKCTYLDAAMLISVAADVRICQMVNPQVTVRVTIPLSVLGIRKTEIP